MKNAYAIEVEDVCVQFHDHLILDRVSFAIPSGHYVGIVGPNGGGKTTLLKVILGLLHPSHGTVQIFGEEPGTARKRGKVGYVPQRVAQADIAFPVSVEEMVWSGRFPVMGLGTRRTQKDLQAVEKAMTLTNVAHLRQQLVGTLSGGERQRTFIARALASEPSLLLLDEPTTGVDVASRQQFYTLLKKLNADLQLTILLVSHDIEVMTSEVAFVLALNQKLVCHCESHQFLSQDMLDRLYGKGVHIPHSHPH